MGKLITLNVGCGHDPWGDIRVDVDDYGRPDVIAEASSLPFRNKVFSEVRCFHVFEHVKDPQRAALEAKRVGNFVHAKFPYKYDRVPDILFMIFTFKPRAIRQAIHDCFWHILTQMGVADHPIAHRWLVQPCGIVQLNKREVSPWAILRYGRKGLFFRRLPKLMMDAEWECWF